MKNRTLLLSLLITAAIGYQGNCFAQAPTWTLNLLDSTKRSDKFTERKLGSERLADKKFTLIRHFFQNTYTRYNYFFNANNKINGVIERAKASQTDDFTKLLSYFPYSLDNTATQKTELDSVIYKATAGILLHDLRNDWIDNMYLLMGKAYFLRKDFDSAAATFQFINYNLFPRKKNEDDSRIVGTNENDEASGSTISIANKEKQNILQKVVSKPPSRNDALVWLARTLTEQGETGEAAGLISTLQHDPNLPKRLKDDLDEVYGYWFYTQNNYDSTAAYLEKALSNTENKQDLARAEFLLAQLYERIGNFDKATGYYNQSSVHTTNALMDIYAQLNNAKMRKGNNEKELNQGIDNLVKLAKKDKFENYKDIIFYSAGDIAMQKPDTAQAIMFFNKSLQFANETNVAYKNKAFIQLGDIAYARKEYKDAYRFYDSLQSGDTSLNDRLEAIQARRSSLSDIVEKIIVIEREDSLQQVAALAPAERDVFVKKLSKRLRKARGLKEEDNSGTTDLITFDSQKNEPVDLFASSSSKGGEWYFYNSALKSKGLSEFKRRWGTRTNADNWRRKSAASVPANKANDLNTAPNLSASNPDGPDTDTPLPADVSSQIGAEPKNKAAADPQTEDISYEGLMSNLPLTKERLDASNNLVAVNLFELGKLYQNKLEDYQQAIDTYESSLKRFPDSLYNGELYFGLFYCYGKLGNKEKADYYKNLTSTKFADSRSAQILNNPAAANPEKKNAEGTKRYENIYTLFIEGKFEQAVAEKKIADSLYGNSYWSPQLLYIEAVYHVKQKEDSAAIGVLNNIISLYPKSPLKPKAERMIDVLGRRKEIEDYLTTLNITRYKEDTIVIKEDRPKLIRNDSNLIVSPKLYDSSKSVANVPVAPVVKENVKAAPVVSGPYTFNAAAAHNVVMILDKVDVTYVNESKNAFVRYTSDNYRGTDIKVTKEVLDKDLSIVVFASFTSAEEAMTFLKKVNRAAPEEISWLPANKYSFVLIDDDNLERLRNTKDVTGYKNLLKKQYPDQFK